MKPYLIQRAKFEDRDPDLKKGIDSIIRLDYMGSAEFEWGALPASLKEIRSHINEYTYLDVPIKDKTITVFCNDSQKTEIKTYLEGLAADKFRCKEYTGFNRYIDGTEYPQDFWWDVLNHLMFWRKDTTFETKFKSIIIHNPTE